MIHLFASETGYLGFGSGYGKCMFIMFVLTVDTVGAFIVRVYQNEKAQTSLEEECVWCFN